MAMIREFGNRQFPLWLLGDSNPQKWAETLDTPLDPRHPARHNIWTPILDVIQDKVYRKARLRIDTPELYIRNAIGDPHSKPAGTDTDWAKEVLVEVDAISELINRYRPPFVFSFGAFSYEFARRALDNLPKHPHGYWGAKKLGDDFRYRLDNFGHDQINIFPLLHATIARGRFMESHKLYCGQPGANYFDYVGTRLAEAMLTHKDHLSIWI